VKKFLAALVLVVALPVVAAETVATEHREFGTPQRVTIRGYDGDAMEPFITRDGRHLLFNNRNDPGVDTRLHVARRIDDVMFDYRGEIKGSNTPALDAVPSLDRHGNLFFISTRSYTSTLSTIHRGRFDVGQVSDVELVEGVSRRKRGIISFDAEISGDGETLFVVDGRFTGGPVPQSADIDIAIRDGNVFRRLPTARGLLKKVNTRALEYAPALSGDLLELFFTRLASSSGTPIILRATRKSVDAPFGPPRQVTTITGFVEAPTLSGDGRSLYYHLREDGRREDGRREDGRREDGRFRIYRVAR
jgi:hypothetical protein